MRRWWETAARPWIVAGIDRAGRRPWTPVLLIAALLIADPIQAQARSRLVIGVFDEIAHLATAAIVLLGVVGGRRLARIPAFTVAALGMSVAIDIDHIPLYAGVPGVADAGSRPYSHSLLTVLVLAVAWLVTGRRWPMLAGAAVGVALHFVRDVATGPGLQLWWPFGQRGALPYGWYLGLVVVLGILAVFRAWWQRRITARS